MDTHQTGNIIPAPDPLPLETLVSRSGEQRR